MTRSLDADELGRGLTNGFLATAIGAAAVVAPRAPAGQEADRLTADRFDQAPVRDGDRYVGHVLTREMADQPGLSVQDLMHPISAKTTVQAEGTIRDVVPVLRDEGFAFVADGDELVGFVTPSDLNKQAGRAYFYLLIARFEIALAELIRDSRTLEQQAELAEKLSDRGREVRGQYLVDRADGREVDYVTYMTFTHLTKLVGVDDEFLRAVGAKSANAWRDQLGGMHDVRNAVMHLTRDLVGTAGGVEGLMRYELVIRETLKSLGGRPTHLTGPHPT